VDPKDTKKDKEGFKPTMTKAQAVKLVHRVVPDLDDKGQSKLGKDDIPKTKKESIREADVLNFAEYEDKVVVVTTSGEKLEHTK